MRCDVDFDYGVTEGTMLRLDLIQNAGNAIAQKWNYPTILLRQTAYNAQAILPPVGTDWELWKDNGVITLAESYGVNLQGQQEAYN